MVFLSQTPVALVLLHTFLQAPSCSRHRERLLAALDRKAHWRR
jgi:hypothetical protein